ncbi:hypothetical protein E4U19_004646 [Claviceps sp. Clav32 group G5]|nr:hypothetical protein E4U19_004646 [Claviceps sp. Clav32 group G5]
MFEGYGHEFEKAYTTSQIDGSAGHYRMVSYSFCGLNFLIRHETDGFISPNEGPSDQLKRPTPSSSKKAQPRANTTAQKVTVLHKGNVVPLESTLEIKTCNKRRSLRFRHIAPQLWVSQTPQLVRAYYDEGRFSQPQVEDVGEEIQEWEHENQKNLKELGALIQEIIRVMKSCGGRGMLRYNLASARLIISSDKDQSDMLPKDLYPKWDEQES